MNFEVSVDPTTSGTTAQELVRDSTRADAEGACRRWGRERSDSTGRFRVERLCAGSYWIKLTTLAGLGRIERFFSIPAENVRVQLDGYLLSIQVLDAKNQPLPESLLSARFFADQPAAGSQPSVLRLEARTDEHGTAVLCFPEPGRVEIRGMKGLQFSPPETVALNGPSFSRSHVIVLSDEHAGSTVRVIVRKCKQPDSTLDDYCVTLYDANTLQAIMRLCSEQEEPDGFIYNIPPGTYLAGVSRRYVGPLDFWLDKTKEKLIPVVLESGGRATLDFCVELGGRMSLLVTDSAGGAGRQGASVQVSVADSGGGPLLPLSFREPDPTGVTVDRKLPLAVRRVTDTVLPAGTYDVITQAEGYPAVRTRVNIHAGVVTETTVAITRNAND